MVVIVNECEESESTFIKLDVGSTQVGCFFTFTLSPSRWRQAAGRPSGSQRRGGVEATAS